MDWENEYWTLVDRAREVIASWEHGDLAAAIRELDAALPEDPEQFDVVAATLKLA